jgi:hypothetical protein
MGVHDEGEAALRSLEAAGEADVDVALAAAELRRGGGGEEQGQQEKEERAHGRRDPRRRAAFRQRSENCS